MAAVLVTGADGFVGSRISLLLERHGHAVRRAARTVSGAPGSVVVGDLSSFADWQELVRNMTAVVHLAARAHVTEERQAGGTDRYRAVNVDATARLAEAAMRHGVRRFVFVSSIGVNGNETAGRAFTESDAAMPMEPYAVSKWLAEQALTQMLADKAMELVVVRPPLLYGPGVKGNMLRVLNLVARGLPLPVGSLREPRSFMGLDNLCDLLLACIDHPAAAGQLFVAADPERRSTAELFETIGAELGRPASVWRCPLPLLQIAAAVVGRGSELRKLHRPLEIDASKSARLLQWRPRTSFAAGIREMVSWFLSVRQ